MAKLRNVAVAGLLGILLCGCQSDSRIGYALPKVPKSDVALLKGARGAHIDGVDNAAIGNADFSREYGWNTVPVTPGVHELVVILHVRNGQSYIQDPWKLSFRCEKGHTYEFQSNDDYGKQLKVVDLTTDQTMLIRG